MWRTAAIGVLAGCAVERGVLTVSDDPDTDVTVDTVAPDEPGPVACDNPIVAVRPADGAVDVPLDAGLEVELAAPEEGVTLRVRVAGRDVPGRTEVDPEDPARFLFVPLAPVRAGLAHELLVAWSCGSASTTFTSARETWRIEARAGRLAAPSATDELEARLATVIDPVWLGLDGLFADRAGGGRAEWLLAAADGLTQSRCVPTARLTGALSDGGRAFDAAAARATFRAGATLVAARNVTVSGGIDPSSREVGGVRLEATLDLRPVVPRVVGPTASVVDLCRSLESGCLLCDDGQAACARFVWEALPATGGGPGLVAKDAAAVGADPACAP